jgi:hypothetical protein
MTESQEIHPVMKAISHPEQSPLITEPMNALSMVLKAAADGESSHDIVARRVSSRNAWMSRARSKSIAGAIWASTPFLCSAGGCDLTKSNHGAAGRLILSFGPQIHVSHAFYIALGSSTA